MTNKETAQESYIVISTEAKRSGEIADYLLTAEGRTKKQGFAGNSTRRSFGALDVLAAQDDEKESDSTD